MTNQNDLPERVTRLDRQMKKCQEHAGAARILASAVDRDVSEFRTILKGHTSVLNALRETQVKHGEKLKQHDARFDRVEAKLHDHDIRFDQIDARMTDGFSTLAVGQAHITALLNIALGKADGEPD